MSKYRDRQRQSTCPNIEADKGSNLSDEYAAKCLHPCPQKEEGTPSCSLGGQ